jgi:hypothetical protein
VHRRRRRIGGGASRFPSRCRRGTGPSNFPCVLRIPRRFQPDAFESAGIDRPLRAGRTRRGIVYLPVAGLTVRRIRPPFADDEPNAEPIDRRLPSVPNGASDLEPPSLRRPRLRGRLAVAGPDTIARPCRRRVGDVRRGFTAVVISAAVDISSLRQAGAVMAQELGGTHELKHYAGDTTVGVRAARVPASIDRRLGLLVLPAADNAPHRSRHFADLRTRI